MFICLSIWHHCSYYLGICNNAQWLNFPYLLDACLFISLARRGRREDICNLVTIKTMKMGKMNRAMISSWKFCWLEDVSTFWCVNKCVYSVVMQMTCGISPPKFDYCELVIQWNILGLKLVMCVESGPFRNMNMKL